MHPVLKGILIVAAVPASIFGILFLYFLITLAIWGDEPIHDRIARECEREYGARGTVAVNDCRIRMMTRYFQEKERDKARSVYDRIR